MYIHFPLYIRYDINDIKTNSGNNSVEEELRKIFYFNEVSLFDIFMKSVNCYHCVISHLNFYPSKMIALCNVRAIITIKANKFD